MKTLEVSNIYKKFGDNQAVNNVSFSVEKGELFGLLGPNGAGKTTTIRILLDIFKADAGSVNLLGGPMTDEKKNRIGYLPEERGLYQDITVERCLSFLASLKGLEGPEAKKRIEAYMERFDLAAHRRKKVKELSKGMQQKAQLIATLVHQPEVIIIDEPFSALDPVNTQMVKDLLNEEREKGTTIVMCTHQMHQVEELCDRLVLINKGQVVLYGSLQEVRAPFASRDLLVRSPHPLPEKIAGVERVEPNTNHVRLLLTPEATPQSVLKTLVELNVPLESFEVAVPTLDEIFIQVVQRQAETAAA